MKTTLVFDSEIDGDDQLLKYALHARDYLGALHTVWEHCRTKSKYPPEDATEAELAVYDEIKALISEETSERGFDVYD